MLSRVRVMALVGADSSSARCRLSGHGPCCERGAGVAEVDVKLLIAVRQPGVRPLALGEPVREGVGGRERGAGLLGLAVGGAGAVGRRSSGGHRSHAGGCHVTICPSSSWWWEGLGGGCEG